MVSYVNIIPKFNKDNYKNKGKYSNSQVQTSIPDSNLLAAAAAACSVCKSNGQIITDAESGEIVCGKCGHVISDKIQDITRPEWRAFSVPPREG